MAARSRTFAPSAPCRPAAAAAPRGWRAATHAADDQCRGSEAARRWPRSRLHPVRVGVVALADVPATLGVPATVAVLGLRAELAALDAVAAAGASTRVAVDAPVDACAVAGAKPRWP